MAASAAFELFGEAALAAEFVFAGGVTATVAVEDGDGKDGCEAVDPGLAGEVGVERGAGVDGWAAAFEDVAFGAVERATVEFAGAGFPEVEVDVEAELPVGLVALALSPGSARTTRGATGAEARYISQAAFVPPAPTNLLRAKVARESPAGVPRVRFTERARF